VPFSRVLIWMGEPICCKEPVSAEAIGQAIQRANALAQTALAAPHGTVFC
jgi:hypothetical protein